MVLSILFLLLLVACSPNSLENFQKEGQLQCRVLACELKKIHTREELLKAEFSLKRKFDSLVALMMEARIYQNKHPDSLSVEDPHPFSEELLEELKRIYAQVEGGREIIERAQKEALIRLDGFEKKIKRY